MGFSPPRFSAHRARRQARKGLGEGSRASGVATRLRWVLHVVDVLCLVLLLCTANYMHMHNMHMHMCMCIDVHFCSLAGRPLFSSFHRILAEFSERDRAISSLVGRTLDLVEAPVDSVRLWPACQSQHAPETPPPTATPAGSLRDRARTPPSRGGRAALGPLH